MTIDERLEALAARHEALTMNVELISRDVESRRQAALADSKRVERVEKHIEGLLKAVEQDAENVRALARIAEIQDRTSAASKASRH